MEKLYEGYKNYSYYQNVLNISMSGPVMALAVEGKDLIFSLHNMIGKSDGHPASIQGLKSVPMFKSIIHVSETIIESMNEISLFFEKDELI